MIKTYPEKKIQKEIVDFMTLRGWFCKKTHGNLYASGFPDLFTCHYKYGIRWVEIKNSDAYRFTGAQIETFHKFAAHGVGVWVLCGATHEEYDKLFRPCNWYWYLQLMK